MTTTLRFGSNSGKVADLSDMANRLDPKTGGIRPFARCPVPETGSAEGAGQGANGLPRFPLDLPDAPQESARNLTRPLASILV
jgi:hypothetical protein